MKLKIRFAGMLLHFTKQNSLSNIFGKSPKDRRDYRYVALLLALWLIVFLMSFNKCKAEVRSLQVGQKMPDVAIGSLINSPVPSVRVSEFRGKVLVLEFWASWCGACIEEMPEVAKLRKTMGGRLQVISVTQQPEQVILNFLKHNALAREQHLTIAVHDSVLSKLFPHKLVPHVVWIGPDGTYLGATTQQDLDEETVRDILNGRHVDFKDPKNDDLGFDADKPLFEHGNGGDPRYRYRCLLTGYQPGLPSTLGIRNDSLGVTIRATNVGLNGLISRALGVSPGRFGHNRFFIEKPLDTLVISAAKNNLFCFELYGLGYDRERAQREMLSYLEHYFGMEVSRQRQNTDCIVLHSTGSHSKLHYIGKDSTDNLSDQTSFGKYMRGERISAFTAFLDHSAGFLPVLDESGILDKVSMEFDTPKPNGIDALNRQLSKYGLTLKKEKRSIDMIVVSVAGDNQLNY